MTTAVLMSFLAEWLELLATEVVYSLVLALTGMAVLRLLRVRVAAVHQAVWALVLLRLILPPGWGSAWSLRSLLAGLGGLLKTAESTEPATYLPFADATFTSAVPVTPAALPLWQPLLFLVWCSGALLIGILVLLRLRHYRQTVATSATVADPRLLQLVERWRHRFKVRRPVRLVSSDACLSPFTTGLLKPAIFLPETVAAWSPEAIEPVVAHEMAHIRRWDELWTFLANIVLALYFFNPVAWLAVRRIGQTREQLGDELVLASGEISPREYGRSLVEVLRLNVFGPRTAISGLIEGVGLIAGKERVEMRLSSILSGAASSRKRSLAGVLITIGLALFLLPMSAVESRAERVSTEPTVVSHLEDGQAVYDFIVGGRVTEPQKLVTYPADFTTEAVQANIQGKVVLLVVIDDQGMVSDTKVIRGLPLGLTESAISSVQHWQFSPATLGGKPVAVRYVLTIPFHDDLPEEDPSRLEVVGQLEGQDIYYYSADGPLSAPQMLETTEPEYTEAARMAKIAGAVKLEVVIDKEGRVAEVKILRGLPLGLSEAAVEAVRQWRFIPAALDGEPVNLRLPLTVHFDPAEKGWRSHQ